MDEVDEARGVSAVRSDPVPVDLVRSALKLAADAVVARRVDAPPEVARLARAKLDAKGLERLRDALEVTPELREAVGRHASADNVDEPGRLWLTRPDGWRARLEQLAPPQADRRLRAVEDKLRRSERRLAELDAENERLRRQLMAADGTAKRSGDQLARLRGELAESRAVARRRENEARQAAEQADVARAARQEAAARLAEVERARSTELPAALDEAAALAAQLATAVGRALAAATRQPSAPSRARRHATPRRSAQRLPGGVRADSEEAFEHLARLPGAVVLVDGYNVAKPGWPEATLQHQREECIRVGENLARRLRTSLTIVFDGADVAGANARARHHVTVEYTAAGVSADDAIRRRVRELPVETPVVVITDDREILDSVRAAGANTIPSEIYLRVARR